jgi:hypothetical protein
MDPRDEMEPDQLKMLAQAFCEQLMACLDECARSRKGLFSDVALLGDEGEGSAWPEATRLRELGVALQAILAQQEERNALCDEFLDLCSIHGESHPGERKLARAFLEAMWARSRKGRSCRGDSARISRAGLRLCRHPGARDHADGAHHTPGPELG